MIYKIPQEHEQKLHRFKYSQLVFGASHIANEQIYADIFTKIFRLFKKIHFFGIRMNPLRLDPSCHVLNRAKHF